MAERVEDPKQPAAIRIFVDADACPVKPEIYRVAERYALHVYVVANSFMAVPRSELIERGGSSVIMKSLTWNDSPCRSWKHSL